jgi:hypothetical protein
MCPISDKDFFINVKSVKVGETFSLGLICSNDSNKKIHIANTDGKKFNGTIKHIVKQPRELKASSTVPTFGTVIIFLRVTAMQKT